MEHLEHYRVSARTVPFNPPPSNANPGLSAPRAHQLATATLFAQIIRIEVLDNELLQRRKKHIRGKRPLLDV